MRYSNYPVDGAHTGVAPQRDFALLQPIASDKDPNALPSYQELVEDSVNGVGTPHPAVISLEPPNGANIPALAKEGESDWVLSVRIGEITMGVILVGKVD